MLFCFTLHNCCSENSRTAPFSLWKPQKLCLRLLNTLPFAVPALHSQKNRNGKSSLVKERLLGSFVLLKDAGFQQFVDELLHGVVGTQETLGRHDDADVALGHGSGTVFTGLEGNEIKTDHGSGKVDLTDAISKNFFLTHE